MPTCRNPGRLDMADTPEAGTDVPSRGLNGHVAEGFVVAHMSGLAIYFESVSFY